MNTILNNFTKGELSPKMDGRVDAPGYHQGCSILENLIILPQGGVTYRPGTRYAGEVKDVSAEPAADQKVRLITFKVSQTDVFILEFGHEYVRFWKDGAQVLDTGSPFEVTTPFQGREIGKVRFVKWENSFYFAHENHHPQKIAYGGSSDIDWTWSVPTFTADPFTGAGDYPAVIAIYQQRVLYAATGNDPNKVWLTKTGDPDDFTIGTADDDAIELPLYSDNSTPFHWAVMSDNILLGSATEEWRIASGGTVTPSSLDIKRYTSFGSNGVQGKLVHGNVLFFQRGGERLRNYRYAQEQESWASEDLTQHADHILRGSVTDYTFQNDPDPIVWMIRGDGELVGLSIDPVSQVLGFYRCPSEGSFVSVAMEPTAGEDRLWFVVDREIGGVTKRYVEYSETRYHAEQEDHYYVDCGITATGSGLTTVSGLTHLEGCTVAVCVDGKPHQQVVVSSGAITLTKSGDKVHVGLPYTAKIRTMRLETGSSSGVGQTKRKVISRLNIRFYETIQAKIGPDEDNLDEILFNTTTQVWGEAVPMYTGDKDMPFPGGHNRDAYLLIVHDAPLPFTLLALVPEVTTE